MGSGKGWPLQAEAAVLPTSPALPAADRDSTELQQLCRGVRGVYGGEGEESVVAACDRRRRAKAPQAYPPGHERLRLRGKHREHRHQAQRDQSLLLELCCGWHCDHRRSDCRGLREFRHGAPMTTRMTRHQRSPSDRFLCRAGLSRDSRPKVDHLDSASLRQLRGFPAILQSMARTQSAASVHRERLLRAGRYE